MAGQTINPTDIAKARESGYSDQEIANFLSAKAPDQFKAARSAGYSDSEILSHLSGAPAPAAAPAAPAAPDAPSGVIAGFQHGIADELHGVGETGKQFAGADPSTLNGASQAVAPSKYTPAQVVPEGGHWYDPRTYNYSQIPQAVAEAAPGMATDIAAAKLGARVHPLVGVGAGLASYLLRTRGDAAKADAATRTGNPDAPVETQDKLRSLATGVAESVPAAIGLGRFLPGGKIPQSAGQALTKALITSGVEGGAGATQNAISQAGQTIGTPGGLKVDPAQVVSAGITSGATGGLLAAPKGLADASNARKYAPLGGENEQATKAFTARITQKLDGDKVTPERSFTALRDADAANRDELKTAAKPLKGQLDNDTADALKRAGKGLTLSDTDLQNIDENTTPDVAHLARQAHVASLIKDIGDYGNNQFVGGMANAVGKHVRAIQSPQGAAVSAALGAAGLGGHAASLFAYGPATLAAILGGYGAMRGVDKLTGSRTPLKGVLDRFSDPNAQVRLPAPETPEAPAPASAGPTGPKVPFNPGVAGGGTALALGQNPFAPKPEAAPQAPSINPLALPKDVTGPAKTLMSALQKVQAMQAAAAPPAPTPAPTIDPLALPKDVSGKSKTIMSALQKVQEMQAAANPPPSAPEPAPAPIDPLALPKSILGKAKTITDAHANLAKMRDTAVGNRAVDRIAGESPLVDEVGGLDAIRNPMVGKRAGQLVSSARALQQLMRQPEEEGNAPAPGTAPVAPVAPSPPTAPVSPAPAPDPRSSTAMADQLARMLNGGKDPVWQSVTDPAPAPKITKKNGGPVDHVALAKAAAQAEGIKSPEYSGEYVPLKDEELWGKGLSDKEFAAKEAANASGVADPKAYADGIVRDRQKRRGILADITGDAPIEDQVHAGELLDQLHHRRRGGEAAKAIKHYTAKMSPEVRDAIRKRMDASFLNSMWSK